MEALPRSMERCGPVGFYRRQPTQGNPVTKYTKSMGSFGPLELLIIFLLVLLIFGAKRIPEIAKGLGRGIREFRDATTDIKKELSEEPPRQVQAPPQAPYPQQQYGAPPPQAQGHYAPPPSPAQQPGSAPTPPPPGEAPQAPGEPPRQD
jgi:sec-independent protein translocase protein TatA